MTRIVTLIPAAGASRRMRGKDKLLEPVGGEALLRRQARIALECGEVIVTLPAEAAQRRQALVGLSVMIVPVPGADEGMAASLRAGIAAVPAGVDGVLVLLADMPDIEASDLRAMIDVFAKAPDAPILRATAQDGQPGHPVLFPRRHFAALASLTGDRGARDLLVAHGNEVRAVPLPGDRAITDLDTPEAWDDWRARNEA